VGQVAQQYFSTIADALRTADPNHLFLGPRMIAQTTGTPVLAVAAKYVDVASFNDYTIIPELTAPLHNADPTYLPVGDGLAAQEQVLHKPILVSEWGYRAADSGLPNTWPPLFPVLDTQAQRAAAYEHFVAGLLDTSWIVGQHFFEFADEPAAGRSDGENSNFGLVDQHDDPYAPVVDISKTMHDCAFARLADAVESPSTSTSAPPTSPSTHPSSTTGRTLASTAPASALPPARAIAAQPAYTG
jgi:agarase